MHAHAHSLSLTRACTYKIRAPVGPTADAHCVGSKAGTGSHAVTQARRAPDRSN